MMPLHRIAVAMRCKLLTGSYSGATRSCPCEFNSECSLSSEERDEAASHPAVKNALARNVAEYEAINTKTIRM